ncbi:MAG: hypothetical protein ABL989_07340 [Gammaproteobacteria bacterium]
MIHARLRNVLLVLTLISGGATAADNWVLDTFCSEVQRVTARTSVKANLTIHKTSWDFRHSKPGIEPVEIHQYVTPDAAGRPKMISCKVKLVDHLKSAYGPAAAGTQGTCEQVTRSVVEQARATTGPRALAVRVDPEEQVWTGSSYLSPFELLSRDASGTLHVHTRYMRIDWDDWRWYVMPNKVRGHLYCHIIAPEYLARVLRGEAPELEPIEVPPEPEAD